MLNIDQLKHDYHLIIRKDLIKILKIVKLYLMPTMIQLILVFNGKNLQRLYN